jgi:hypothetical protein
VDQPDHGARLNPVTEFLRLPAGDRHDARTEGRQGQARCHLKAIDIRKQYIQEYTSG